MAMTPRQIAANYHFMVMREKRLTANMVIAVRLGMNGSKKDLEGFFKDVE